LLTTLKEHPEAWTRVDAILEFSQNQETKYYALQILENVIKTRWKALPRTQCEGQRSHPPKSRFIAKRIYFKRLDGFVSFCSLQAF
jgi:hypothetical protein